MGTIAVASNHHHQRIDSVVHLQSASSVDRRVRESWRRCLNQHGLDPNYPKRPAVIDRAELKRRRHAIGPCFQVAAAEMQQLGAMLKVGAGIAFTDMDGVILQYQGAPAFAEIARRSGFREGAVWSESEQGTNGMGTCLIARESVVIERSDHFLKQNTDLTCFAAPVLDGVGGLSGALDISCTDLLPRTIVQALLEVAIHNIETRQLLFPRRDRFVLRFHRRREWIGTAMEGVIAFDPEGFIIGVNRDALNQLGLAQHADICGRNVKELFGFDLNEPERRLPQQLFGQSGNKIGFGLVQQPYARSLDPRAADSILRGADTLAVAEKRALLEVLDLNAWNVTKTAKQLGIGRKTLHRRINKYRLGKPSTLGQK